MKNLIFTLAILLVAATSWAQNPQVQIIHNSPDPAAATVDIWVNGTKAVDDLSFREATAFLTLSAGQNIVGIAPPTSTAITDTIFSYTYNLMMNTNYVIVANGVINVSNYNPPAFFGLDVYASAQTTSSNANEVDVLVHHGSSDAPTVDVRGQDPSTVIVDNASFGAFAGYASLADEDAIIRITDQTGSSIVASYEAPINTLGLAGNAITVVASGFLDPSQNSNGPAFGLYVALPTGGPLVALPAASAPRVQIIHNSPDAAAASVDIYANGNLIADDLAFREATAYISAFTGANAVGIAPANSTSVNDTIANFDFNLLDGNTYVAVANGTLSGTGYSPFQPFGIDVYDMAREAATDVNDVDILVHHGSTDAPTVDVRGLDPSTVLVDDAPYGAFAGYLSVAEEDIIVRITDVTGSTIVASYEAPLNTLGLAGNAITVVASGFLDPAQNSNGPAFGLYVALATGGPLVALPAAPAPRVQIIHNSPDAGAASVDVYVNGAKVADDLNFRVATAFIDAFTGANAVGIAPASSTSVADTIANFDFNLLDGYTYIAVANGTLSGTGYSPFQPFGIDVYDMAREAATMPDMVDVLVHHGSTDAPTVDVRGADTTTVLVDDAPYGAFAGYLSLDTMNVDILITDASGATVVKKYTAPLDDLNLGGAAITVVASGFLDPSVNSNGEAFGLYVALASGGPLVALPEVVTSSITELNAVNDLKAFPNPVNNQLNLSWSLENDSDVNLEWYNLQGQLVKTAQLGEMNAGTHNLSLNTADLADGFYSLVIRSNKGINALKVQVRH
jgi:Ni,Fe-hydrogenase maturation factor